MRITTLISMIALMTVAVSASAHHSKAAHFDTSRTVTITGEVVKWRFRSPHSSLLLNVTEEDGSVHQWTIEGSAAPTLRRQGMDRNSFAPGDIVDVRAEPSRKPDARVAFALTFRTADGRILGERKKLDEGAELESDIQGIQRLAGRWQGLGAGGRFPIALNASGQEAWENHDDAQSPANTCEPVNIPAILHVPNFLFDVRISDSEAILRHEIYQVTRTVSLNSEPSQAEPTGTFGVVIGRIEGEELVVESNQFPPSLWGLAVAAIPPGNGRDIPSSAQKRVIERFSSRDEGKTLRVEYTVEDPAYLTEPYKGYRDFSRVSDDTPMHPYECDTESASRYTTE